MKEAMLYSKEDGGKVHCFLCRHGCRIKAEGYGICNVRYNDGGTLYPIFYGRPISMAVDPIEKKPFFHYKPGTTAFSIACPGCNFQCSFCQNWEISQYGRTGFDLAASTQEVTPEQIVANAEARRCSSISYTYTEPTIFFEYAYDIARLAKERGIGNNFVTNGYMSREALDMIRPYLDAANVDLKAFRKETYRKVMKGELDGVLDSIRYMKELGIWVEVTTLVVPGMNDDPAELRGIANFLAETGRDIPWHVSRFTPRYKMDDAAPTPTETIQEALQIGRKAGLRYVYAGNVPGDPAEHTRCYECGETLIERVGFFVRKNSITERGECPKCKAKIDGVGIGRKA
jgi:pyruvate formate lyase activating enzyme